MDEYRHEPNESSSSISTQN